MYSNRTGTGRLGDFRASKRHFFNLNLYLETVYFYFGVTAPPPSLKHIATLQYALQYKPELK